jgi:hypothetical protein
MSTAMAGRQAQTVAAMAITRDGAGGASASKNTLLQVWHCNGG